MHVPATRQPLALLALANATPLFTKKTFGNRFAQPLDGLKRCTPQRVTTSYCAADADILPTRYPDL
jgi:hypothetical protein